MARKNGRPPSRRMGRRAAKGAAWLVFKGTPRAVRKTFSAGKRGAKWVSNRRKDHKFPEGYRAERGEVPIKAFSIFKKATCGSCGKPFGSIEDCTQHYYREHAKEKPEPATHDRVFAPELTKVATGRHRGKVTVTANSRRGQGRHRPRSGRTPATDLIGASDKQMIKIGESVAKDFEASALVMMAFQRFAETPPGTLNDTVALATAMAHASAMGADAIRQHVGNMMAHRQYNLTHLRGLLKVAEMQEDIAAQWREFPKDITDQLRDQIAAARKLQATDGPSAETLAG